jgi:hypothetical protein
LTTDVALATLKGILETSERRVTDSLARRIMTVSAISAEMATVFRR